ncbi:MAG: mannose-6-phosphate isomerase, class I, partial [Chitinophagaceae bacterium]|nr:mannose-6-phosphate isomerase, class I [Chitinophagaceae bacterium]
MDFQNKILQLKGKVQHYAWGGSSFIPSLLHIDNAENKPHAEYWMGTHPSAPSELFDGAASISLDQFIQQNPIKVLGEKVFKQFKALPYLFKVLDVNDMLSIQVHPSKAEAEKGFDAEEAAGIPLNAPNRNYKDSNHKPEIMVALSEFWLLHGFKSKEAIEKMLLD